MLLTTVKSKFPCTRTKAARSLISGLKQSSSELAAGDISNMLYLIMSHLTHAI